MLSTAGRRKNPPSLEAESGGAADLSDREDFY